MQCKRVDTESLHSRSSVPFVSLLLRCTSLRGWPELHSSGAPCMCDVPTTCERPRLRGYAKMCNRTSTLAEGRGGTTTRHPTYKNPVTKAYSPWGAFRKLASLTDVEEKVVIPSGENGSADRYWIGGTNYQALRCAATPTLAPPRPSVQGPSPRGAAATVVSSRLCRIRTCLRHALAHRGGR